MTDDHLKKVSLNSQSDDVKTRRAKIERDIAEFQQRGGQINEIPSHVMAGKSQTLSGSRAGVLE